MEFHSLRAPPWEPPRREGKMEDETHTTLRGGSSEEEGSPTRPAFTAFVYPPWSERFTIVKLVETILSSMNSVLVRLSSKQAVYRSHQRSSMINFLIYADNKILLFFPLRIPCLILSTYKEKLRFIY